MTGIRLRQRLEAPSHQVFVGRSSDGRCWIVGIQECPTRYASPGIYTAEYGGVPVPYIYRAEMVVCLAVAAEVVRLLGSAMGHPEAYRRALRTVLPTHGLPQPAWNEPEEGEVPRG